MPELTEQQLQAFQNASALLRQLYNDPEDGMAFKKLLKKKFPKAAIPEVDAANHYVAPITARMDGLEKTIKDFMDAFGGKAAEFELDKKIDAATQRFKLTTQGVADLRKLMKERAIADPEVAAGFLVASAPPAPVEPSGYTGKRWDFMRAEGDEAKENMKSLLDDPDGWLEQVVPQIINEERQKNGNVVRTL